MSRSNHGGIPWLLIKTVFSLQWSKLRFQTNGLLAHSIRRYSLAHSRYSQQWRILGRDRMFTILYLCFMIIEFKDHGSSFCELHKCLALVYSSRCKLLCERLSAILSAHRYLQFLNFSSGVRYTKKQC